MLNPFLFVIMCLAWGSTWLAIKIGVATAPPLLFAGVRFLLAGSLLLGWHRWRHGKVKVAKGDWLTFFKIALTLIALAFGLICWGEQYVDSGLTAILNQGSIPILTFMMTWFYRHEQFSWTRAIGVLLGALGLLLVFTPSVKSPSHPLEFIAMIGMIVGTAFGCWGAVISKEVMSRYSAVYVTGIEGLLGGIMLILASFMLEFEALMQPSHYLTSAVLLSGLYLLVVGSIIAFTIYNYLLNIWGTFRVSLFSFISPIIALIIGAVLNHEPFTVYKVIGTLIILSGIALILRRQKLT